LRSQPNAAPGLPVEEMPSRAPDGFAALRSFFVKVEPQLPGIVASLYEKACEAEPGVALLFKGTVHEQRMAFLGKLESIVKLTRSSHLWPASTPAGQMLIPEVMELAKRSAKRGITPAHFAVAKLIIVLACKEAAPSDFTPEAEEALTFIFDVLAQSMTAGVSGADALSKLRLRESGAPLFDPSTYFDEELTAAKA